MGAKVTPLEQEFWEFAPTVPVVTKDEGIVHIGYGNSWGSQRRFVSKVFNGMAAGKRRHFSRKARQLGITEVARLISLFLLFKFPGLQGAFIIDDEENCELYRDLLTQMALGTCRAPECPHDGTHAGGIRLKNKRQIAWDNGSRLAFQYAGVRERKHKKLGVGRGIAFAHVDEASLYMTPAISAYLQSAFSAKHPAACYMFFGTARGRNPWYDVLEDAEVSTDAQVIDLCWWMREDQALALTDPGYRKYWDGRLTPRERRWVRDVERRYEVSLTAGQLAWRRQYVVETAGNDERMADQEMPTLPEDAFEATGQSFVSLDVLRRYRREIGAAPAPTWYRYEFGTAIEDTDIKKTVPSHGTLAMWAPPEPAHAYVVAAVPAFSADSDDPTYVASVWKATRDSLEQVAEFSDEESGMQPFAWVWIHLMGIYQAPRQGSILETSGVGQGVLDEYLSLRSRGWGTRQRLAVTKAMGRGEQYTWRRPDSLAGGAARQWKTTVDTATVVMNRLRDQLVNGAVILRSERCSAELERIRRDGNAFIPEGRGATSHHLHAAALAVESWAKQIRPIFERVQGAAMGTTVLDTMVGKIFGGLAAAGAK